MNTFGFVVLVAILGEYVLSLTSTFLNLRSQGPTVPKEFETTYEPQEYQRSQDYTRTQTQFGVIASTIQLAIFLLWWFGGGFDWLDQIIRGFGYNSIINGLLYIGSLWLATTLLALPFNIYSTFVIEQQYGFNRTTPATFFADQLKGLVLTIFLGSILVSVILAFFEWSGSAAWLWCWLATSCFLLVVQFVAPTWIMPIFNTFTPLRSGELHEAILNCSRKADFPLKEIFVVDGSRRSSKANAFFTGFGKNKRIGLFDTLVEKYSVGELVAVVAHEIGHYKKRHILKGMILSLLYSGVMFFLLALVLQQQSLFDAFYMSNSSLYAGFVFFGLLFTPIELVLSLYMNRSSRKNEFEADAFAAETTGRGEDLISALKKLSADSLSNLTPHPLHVFLNYSHPPVLRRIEALRRNAENSLGSVSS